jgi:hypothetical protein
MKLILHAVCSILNDLLKQLAAISVVVAIVCGISWALMNHPFIFIPTVVICIFLIAVVFKVAELKDIKARKERIEHETT